MDMESLFGMVSIKLMTCFQVDPVCSVCFDGECYDMNEIVMCDKCNMAAHQSCYDIKSIPSGSW